jgi:hypothetical protein
MRVIEELSIDQIINNFMNKKVGKIFLLHNTGIKY